MPLALMHWCSYQKRYSTVFIQIYYVVAVNQCIKNSFCTPASTDFTFVSLLAFDASSQREPIWFAFVHFRLRRCRVIRLSVDATSTDCETQELQMQSESKWCSPTMSKSIHIYVLNAHRHSSSQILVSTPMHTVNVYNSVVFVSFYSKIY